MQLRFGQFVELFGFNLHHRPSLPLPAKKAGQMHRFFPGMIAAEVAADVEEAAGFAQKQQVGPAGQKILHFILHHGLGDVRVIVGKLPAEPAAGVGRVQGDHLDSFHCGDQLLRLLRNPQPAQDVTGFMVGDLPLEGCAHVFYLQDVHEILGKLKDPGSKFLGPAQPFRLIRQKFRVVVFHHAHTGARGTDDDFIVSEDVR